MEYLNRIEIMGKTGQHVRVITHAGEPVGYCFQVATQNRYKVGEDETVETTWHDVKVLTTRGSATAGFVFRRSAPIHVFGRLAFTYAATSRETGESCKDVVIEASSAKYLDEKKGGPGDE